MLQAILGFFTKPAIKSTVEPSMSEGNWLSDKLKWSPTSMNSLLRAEEKILSFIKTPFSLKYIDIPGIEGCDKSCQIRTLYFKNDQSPSASRVPLVLLHGLGSAVGLWLMNLDALAQQGPVYALDILGFGASSRPTFSSDPKAVEEQLIKSIEHWRQAMELDNFILLGHSMGGFLASSYAINFPNHVKHLILADPWGFPERDKSVKRHINAPLWVKAIATVLRHFNPLAGLRVAGPWGPNLIARIRPDILAKYEACVDDLSVVSNYIYHCNAQNPSGEMAFKSMSESLGWAKYPMVSRIETLQKNIPITFIYGAQSWMDSNSGYIVKELRKDSYVEVQMIIGAGHHIYGDQPEIFNDMVLKVCDQVNHVSCKLNEKSHLDTLSETLSEAYDYSV